MRKFLVILIVFVMAMVLIYIYFDIESIELNDEIRKKSGKNYVKTSAGYTHYEITGTGNCPSIVLIHGYSSPLQTWKHQVKTLSDSGFCLLVFDLLGRGYSDRPDVIYDLDLFTQQLEDLLMALNIDTPVDLIGLSLGSHIAANFTIKNQLKVTKIILLNPQITPLKNNILELPLIGEFFMKVRVIPNLKTFQYQKEIKGFSRALLSTTRELSGIDPIKKYQQIASTHEVALIWGNEDTHIHSLYNKQNQPILQNVKYYFVENAGHAAHHTNPEKVNQFILQFLN